MTECDRCGAKTQLPLCQRCITKIHDILTELPWWLDRLTETALGQAKLGSLSRRTQRPDTHLNGDATLASHIEAFPDDNEPDLDEARRQRYAAARRHALALGGVHPSAADLLDTITNMLSTWIRDICETRGHHLQLRGYRNKFIGPLPVDGIRCDNASRTALLALWLAEHINAVALSPGADEFCDELSERLRAIRRIVNRPNPAQPIGQCVGSVQLGHDRDCHKRHPHRCGDVLYARHHDIEITCPTCKTVHNVERLKEQNLNELEHRRYLRAELHKVLQHYGERVAPATLHDWLKTGKLKPAGYQRPDGRFGLTRHSDEDKPVYRLADARKLRAANIRKALA